MDIDLYKLVLKIWEYFGTELMLKQVHEPEEQVPAAANPMLCSKRQTF